MLPLTKVDVEAAPVAEVDQFVDVELHVPVAVVDPEAPETVPLISQ